MVAQHLLQCSDSSSFCVQTQSSLRCSAMIVPAYFCYAGGKRPVQVVIQEGICGGIPSSNLQVAGIPKGRDLRWDLSDP